MICIHLTWGAMKGRQFIQFVDLIPEFRKPVFDFFFNLLHIVLKLCAYLISDKSLKI